MLSFIILHPLLSFIILQPLLPSAPTPTSQLPQYNCFIAGWSHFVVLVVTTEDLKST